MNAESDQISGALVQAEIFLLSIQIRSDPWEMQGHEQSHYIKAVLHTNAVLMQYSCSTNAALRQN